LNFLPLPPFRVKQAVFSPPILVMIRSLQVYSKSFVSPCFPSSSRTELFLVITYTEIGLVPLLTHLKRPNSLPGSIRTEIPPSVAFEKVKPSFPPSPARAIEMSRDDKIPSCPLEPRGRKNPFCCQEEDYLFPFCFHLFP